MVAVTCSAFPIFCPQSDLPLYPFRCASFTVSGHSCPRTFAWGLIFGSGVIPWERLECNQGCLVSKVFVC